jgi:hypothetical protein
VTALDAEGLSVELPPGWEGEIYVRPPEPGATPAAATATARRQGQARPVLQLADFALPRTRGDFGGGAVELMGPRNIFVSLFEHGPESVGTPLFAAAGTPWPVAPADFGPNRLQRPLPGQAGGQWFFHHEGRAFCLYAVLGSYALRVLLARPLNHALARINISPP